MFTRNKNPQQPITPVQKVLTYGLILFIIYLFISERKEKLAPAYGFETATLKVTNRLTGEVKTFRPGEKILLDIRAADVEKIRQKPVFSPEDRISLFEITIVKPEDEPKTPGKDAADRALEKDAEKDAAEPKAEKKE